MNRQKSKPETFAPKIESPEIKIGYIWSSTSHQYKPNAPNIQISSPPFDVRFVHPVLNYGIVRIVNSSISTQPATLQQLIVMTKSRKYNEFILCGNPRRVSTTKVTQTLSETTGLWCQIQWNPKAYQHHRSDPDTIRNQWNSSFDIATTHAYSCWQYLQKRMAGTIQSWRSPHTSLKDSLGLSLISFGLRLPAASPGKHAKIFRLVLRVFDGRCGVSANNPWDVACNLCISFTSC